jgi:hypothetical protein
MTSPSSAISESVRDGFSMVELCPLLSFVGYSVWRLGGYRNVNLWVTICVFIILANTAALVGFILLESLNPVGEILVRWGAVSSTVAFLAEGYFLMTLLTLVRGQNHENTNPTLRIGLLVSMPLVGVWVAFTLVRSFEKGVVTGSFMARATLGTLMETLSICIFVLTGLLDMAKESTSFAIIAIASLMRWRVREDSHTSELQP